MDYDDFDEFDPNDFGNEYEVRDTTNYGDLLDLPDDYNLPGSYGSGVSRELLLIGLPRNSELEI